MSFHSIEVSCLPLSFVERSSICSEINMPSVYGHSELARPEKFPLHHRSFLRVSTEPAEHGRVVRATVPWARQE